MKKKTKKLSKKKLEKRNKTIKKIVIITSILFFTILFLSLAIVNQLIKQENSKGEELKDAPIVVSSTTKTNEDIIVEWFKYKGWNIIRSIYFPEDESKFRIDTENSIVSFFDPDDYITNHKNIVMDMDNNGIFESVYRTEYYRLVFYMAERKVIAENKSKTGEKGEIK